MVSLVQEVSSAVQTRIVSSVQEVSSAVQKHAQKGVVLRQTAIQAATQTERVIQIQTIDHIMLFYLQSTIMRSNVLFQA